MKLEKEPTSPSKKVDKKTAEAETKKFQDELFKLQNLLYAEHKHSLLIILQGMDASGKDGTIRHVFNCVNPQGCDVKPFKTPTDEEKAHDFLWRIHSHTPAKGMMQIFNRSHYEDILYPLVHKLLPDKIIEKRFKAIDNFEKELTENGTVIIKFFLNISKKEQKKRLKERLTIPHKKWKYDPADKTEEKYWDDYMKVYEMIFKNSKNTIPWHIVPSDARWYRNYFIAKKLVETLNALNMKYPS
jgi:PPK2 family polyphosphate:nucleotide phosphotransferase